MSVESDITSILFARMAALVLTPVHPIAWPNMRFAPPSNGRWIRVNQFPTYDTKVAIADNGPSVVGGFMQVDLIGPINNGMAAQQETASAIASHFRLARRLYLNTTRLEITHARVSRSFIDEGRWMVPITINYRVIAEM
jgi:hypothetical protein